MYSENQTDMPKNGKNADFEKYDLDLEILNYKEDKAKRQTLYVFVNNQLLTLETLPSCV